MKRLLLLAAFVATPLFAQELRLDAPAPGAVLHGGREGLIAWSADTLPAGANEWEAFLSVDGGAHYAVRLTPHLDATIRAFRFRVPNVSTRDARILLRTGDEEHERIISVPRSFAIEADYARLDFGSGIATEARGESARFDDDHVVEWRDASGEMRHRDSGAVEKVASAIDESPDAVTPSSVCTTVSTPRFIARVANLSSRPKFRAIARNTLHLSTRLNI
jgi:hypothetical protein